MGKCGPKFQNSSNINEVIIPVLNFLIFFYDKLKFATLTIRIS